MDLEEPAEIYLGGWSFPTSGFDHRSVTLERLLRHTGGTSLDIYPGFPPGSALPTVEESLSGATNGAGDVRVVYAPGSRTQYSGGGMTVLQLAIDRTVAINFLSYRTHVEESIFRPLGIVSSRFVLTPALSNVLATPYDKAGAPIEQRVFKAHAAAGLMTTVDDMVTFAESLISIYHGESFPIRGFNQASVTRLLRQARGPAPVYGFGHQVRRIGNVSIAGQIGGSEGWSAHFQVDPEHKNAIVVLTNSSNGGAVHNALVCRWIEEVAGFTSAEFCLLESNQASI